jgi:hypothetical protein
LYILVVLVWSLALVLLSLALFFIHRAEAFVTPMGRKADPRLLLQLRLDVIVSLFMISFGALELSSVGDYFVGISLPASVLWVISQPLNCYVEVTRPLVINAFAFAPKLGEFYRIFRFLIWILGCLAAFVVFGLIYGHEDMFQQVLAVRFLVSCSDPI